MTPMRMLMLMLTSMAKTTKKVSLHVETCFVFWFPPFFFVFVVVDVVVVFCVIEFDFCLRFRRQDGEKASATVDDVTFTQNTFSIYVVFF